MEEDSVKCFVVMARDAPLERRVSRSVRVLAQEGAESNNHLFPESCLRDDWTDDYTNSEAFESECRALTGPDDGQKGPKGLTKEDGKLYRKGRLLVQRSLVLDLCQAWHHHMMHSEVKKHTLDMQRRLEIHEIGLHNSIKQVKNGCLVCQACNSDNQNVKGESQWTPIPYQRMEKGGGGCLLHARSSHRKRLFRLCGPVCGPTRWLHCGHPGEQKGVAGQGRSQDDSSLADRLWCPSHHLQRLWTPVYWRLVQGHVFPHGDTAC